MKKIILCLSLLTLVSCYRLSLRIPAPSELSLQLQRSCEQVISNEFREKSAYSKLLNEDLIFEDRVYSTCEKQRICSDNYLFESGVFNDDDWALIDSFSVYSFQSMPHVIEKMREKVPNSPEAQLRIDIFEKAYLHCQSQYPLNYR